MQPTVPALECIRCTAVSLLIVDCELQLRVGGYRNMLLNLIRAAVDPVYCSADRSVRQPMHHRVIYSAWKLAAVASYLVAWPLRVPLVKGLGGIWVTELENSWRAALVTCPSDQKE